MFNSQTYGIYLILSFPFSFHGVVVTDNIQKEFVNELINHGLAEEQIWTFTGPLLKTSSKFEKLNPFNCTNLFLERRLTPVTWPPPSSMPSHLHHAYTMGGLMNVSALYFANSSNGGTGYKWPAEYINYLRKKINTCGFYGVNFCDKIIKKFKDSHIKFKHGAVVGSESPWAEAALIEAGANHVLTIEYMNITTDHKNLSTIRPEEVASSYLSNTWKPVDFIWSYSSIEHDGLGRYGDPLNPFGDIEAVAKMHCLLKPGGVLFLGMPVGADRVFWNAHRVSGRMRLPLLLSYWDLLYVIGPVIEFIDKQDETQPVFVLRKRKVGSAWNH